MALTNSCVRLSGAMAPDPARYGGKGASLVRLTALGLPVPPGFVITADVCASFREGALPAAVIDELRDCLRGLEAQTGRQFGAGPRPLLVSVRSGRGGLDAGDDGHGAQRRL
jgi:pyruvate, orthophosphate dikinase